MVLTFCDGKKHENQSFESPVSHIILGRPHVQVTYARIFPDSVEVVTGVEWYILHIFSGNV